MKALLTAAVLGMVAVALLGADYALSQFAFVATWAIAGLGLNLIVGQAGQISLGHGAFLGIGAYVEGLLAVAGWPLWLSAPAAVALAAAAGWVASLPGRRLGGMAFAMSTLAIALLVEEGLVRWESVTGGAAGLAVPSLRIAGQVISGPLGQFLVSTALLIVAYACCRRWVASRIGRAWRAVREDETAAAAVGIDCGALRSLAFVLGAGLAGLAGVLYAHWLAYLSPEQFGLQLSFELLMLVFIGGAGRLAGALWGAAVIVALPQLISLLTDALPARWGSASGVETMAFGLLIVLIILLRPAGIAGERRQAGREAG